MTTAPIDRAALEREFVERLRQRWARGARDYGDASFHAAPDVTVGEILSEVEDVAGWAFVLWVSLRQRLHAVTDNATTMQDLHARIDALTAERDHLHHALAGIATVLDRADDAPTRAALVGILREAAAIARVAPHARETLGRLQGQGQTVSRMPGAAQAVGAGSPPPPPFGSLVQGDTPHEGCGLTPFPVPADPKTA